MGAGAGGSGVWVGDGVVVAVGDARVAVGGKGVLVGGGAVSVGGGGVLVGAAAMGVADSGISVAVGSGGPHAAITSRSITVRVMAL